MMIWWIYIEQIMEQSNDRLNNKHYNTIVVDSGVNKTTARITVLGYYRCVLLIILSFGFRTDFNIVLIGAVIMI